MFWWSVGDDYLPFEGFTGSEGQQSPSAQGEEKDTLELTTVDRNRLQPWLNAEYLQPAVMASIRKRFCKDSSMQLREFLRADVAAKVATAAGAADSLCGLGAGRPPADYSVGVGAGWSVVSEYTDTASEGKFGVVANSLSREFQCGS